DLLLGDPRFFPHPVKIIGFLCTCCENLFRRIFRSSLIAAGGVTVVTVLFVTLGTTASLLSLMAAISQTAAILVGIFLLYTSVAARDLVVHSRAVYRELQDSETLDPARRAVGMIVGRDTENLERKEIVRACVETVAENMVDGVTAPLFYAIVVTLVAPITGVEPLFLALLGALGYKAVNTMDSMFGYKNERYLRFGRVAARLDDLVNFIPARLSALILIPAAFLSGLDARGAWRILLRDRLAHASPNGGHPEAAFGGALGVQLGGSSSYFGKETMKPLIGEAKRELEGDDILRSNRLMLVGSLLFLLVMLGLRRLILFLVGLA
ncbi:MAG: adenosylcobinamide-phosphate synthase CbiB, partial [Thermodesulfobacteriota bacterium]